MTVRLGDISCPCGELVIMDGGYLDHWQPVAGRASGPIEVDGVPAVLVTGLPRDRPLWVEATEVDGGWGEFRIEVSPAPVAETRELGTVLVDWARIAFADAAALTEWLHHEPIDGRADVAFWGRSEVEAAEAHAAPLLGTPGEEGVYGWRDLPVAEAEQRVLALYAWLEADPTRKMMVDYRPHSHHFQAMAGVRASTNGAGMVDVGGARILFTHTSWGDGYFPVYADHGSAGELVAIRVQLAE